MFGRGGESDEVEVETADECVFIGGGGGCEVVAFEFMEDEVVDGVLGPVLVIDFWDGGWFGGDEGPVCGLCLVGGVGVFGPGGAGLDPLFNEVGLFFGEWVAFGGHTEFFVVGGDDEVEF